MSRRPADAVQPDLFGEFDRAEEARLADAFRCLKEVVPEALEIVVRLAPWRAVSHRRPRSSGCWAYTVCHDGIRYEHVDEWWTNARARGESFGWDRTPAKLVTWEELRTHLQDAPARAKVCAWAEGLPASESSQLSRPYELWPGPANWHPSYVQSDRQRPGWEQRMAAWQLVMAILTAAEESAHVSEIWSEWMR